MQLHYYLYHKKIPGVTYACVATKTRPDNRGFKIAGRNYQPTVRAHKSAVRIAALFPFFFSNFDSEMRLRYVMKDVSPELSSRGTARFRPFITRRDNDNKVIRRTRARASFVRYHRRETGNDIGNNTILPLPRSIPSDIKISEWRRSCTMHSISNNIA